MHEDVLHLGISVASLGTSEVVQPRQGAEEVVDDSNDDGDTDRVTPDDNNSDDAGVAVAREVGGHIRRVRWITRMTSQPAEDTEEGGDDIDTEDGANELPRGPCVTTTSDEDEPVLSQ